MPTPAPLSPFADDLRRLDRDRFVLSLFAPEAARPDWHALFAFNLEIARVRELVREPMLGRIRLQWWRDIIAGLYDGASGSEHPAAAALGGAIRRHGLSRALFDGLLDAREQDLDPAPPDDVATLEDYAAGTSANLQLLALEMLGQGGSEPARQAARHVGIAWALVGLLRAFPYHAATGRIALPFDLLDAHQVEVEPILSGKPPREPLAKLGRELAELAAGHLAQARALRRQVPRPAVVALLPASLAELYLRRLRAVGWDITDQRWSRTAPRPALLAWKALWGRY